MVSVLRRAGIAAACLTAALAAAPAAHAQGLGTGSLDTSSLSGISGAVSGAGLGTTAFDSKAYAAGIVQVVNEYRTKAGLGPVAENSKVDAVAQAWTDHVVADRIAPTPDKAHNPNVGTQAPAGSTVTAENCTGTSASATPRQVVDSWTRDAAHDSILFQPKVNTIGVGATTGYVYTQGGIFVCADFLAY